MINIAGEDSRVTFSMAEADGIYDEYESTITALHTIVIMMMFMSMSLTLLLGLTQRYNEIIQQANGEAEVAAVEFVAEDFMSDSPPAHRRGRGLHPEIIDTIPHKIYRSVEVTVGDAENSNADEGDKDDCCPICLVEYEDGDELRVLPCNHCMHKTCVDAWLRNNPSCPSCRYSLSELVDDRPMMQLRTLRSRLSSSSSAWTRFLSSQNALFLHGPIQLQYSREEDSERSNEIEMTTDFGDGPGLPRTVIDLRYLPSLVLTEEDLEDNGTGEEQQRGDFIEDPSSLDATMERGGTTRTRRSQRERIPRLAGLRNNVAQIRRHRRRLAARGVRRAG